MHYCSLEDCLLDGNYRPDLKGLRLLESREEKSIVPSMEITDLI